RIYPLWPETARLLREYLDENGIHPNRPEIIFHNHWGTDLTRFGVRIILRKHVQRAAQQMPALKRKRLHPHCLRQNAVSREMPSCTGNPARLLVNWRFSEAFDTAF
ncbi:MAG: hypothetical protein JZU63_14175, partial [Rhodoferax sp.]|nr:hypothetical protein [Rhodoferax sp.]